MWLIPTARPQGRGGSLLQRPLQSPHRSTCERVLGGAVGERLQDLQLDLGRVVQEAAEAGLVDDEHADRARRGHGRVPRTLRDERHLAEEGAGAERLRLAPLGADVDRPVDEEEELVALPTLLDQLRPRRQAQLVGERRDLTQFLLACSPRTAAPAAAVRASRPCACARSDPNFRCRSGKRMTWCEFGGFGSQLGIQGGNTHAETFDSAHGGRRRELDRRGRRLGGVSALPAVQGSGAGRRRLGLGRRRRSRRPRRRPPRWSPTPASSWKRSSSSGSRRA